MLEIRTSNDGSFRICFPSIKLGYRSDSQQGSSFYYKSNSLYIGRGVVGDFYFSLELHLGEMTIKASI